MTFLFSDIEGSTDLLRTLGSDRYRSVLERHRALLRAAVESAGGSEVDAQGDSMFFAFAGAPAAVAAAVAGQQALQREEWGDVGPVLVRMGLHTGTAQPSGGYYASVEVHRAARIAAAAHGGQILSSESAAAAAQAGSSPPGFVVTELGSFRLKGFDEPCLLFEVSDPQRAGPARQPRAPTAAGHNLPVQVSSFLGRHRELRELTKLIGDERLVTLFGPGGSGKTRLALEVASSPELARADGVWLVRLAETFDPAMVAQEVASALGVRLQPGRDVLDELAAACADRRMLLVLDNCEQVVTAAAELTARLLATCAHLSIVATSRTPLAVAGEHRYPVQPFTVPPTGAAMAADIVEFDAVRLFTERAQAHHPGFVLDDSTAGPVAAICRRLDGMPLAIELAAARLRSLNVADIERHLNDQLALLVNGPRSDTPHHRGLRAAIEWSFNLLSDEERESFVRLSVFAGSFDVAAAEAVCPPVSATVVDDLTALVDKSLLQPQRGGPGGLIRYSMLQTVRDYGQTQLLASGQKEAIAAAHARYYASVAEQAASEAQGPAEASAVARFDAEFDNIRAAYRTCVDTEDWDGVQRILLALVDELVLRERFEVGRWATELLDGPDCAGHPVVAVAQAMAANMAIVEGNLHEAAALGLAALAGTSPEGRNATWLTHSVLALVGAAGEVPDPPQQHFSAMAAMTEATGQPMALAVSLFDEALIEALSGRSHKGLPAAERLLALGRKHRNPSMLAMGLLSVGRAEGAANPDRARVVLQQALRQAESVRSNLLAHQARRAMSVAAGSAGRDAANDSLASLAAGLAATRDPSQQMQTLLASVRHLVDAGFAELGVLVCGFLSATPLALSAVYRTNRDLAKSHVRAEDYWDSWESGASLSLSELVALFVSRVATVLDSSP